MNAALHARRTHSGAQRWSFAAFMLAVVGLAASIWVIFGSETDTAEVRWWLVFVPLFVTSLPVALPQRGMRVAAVGVLATWCAVTGLSIGIFLLPALIASVASLVREAA